MPSFKPLIGLESPDARILGQFKDYGTLVSGYGDIKLAKERQKVLDDRATTLFNQQQEEYARKEKEYAAQVDLSKALTEDRAGQKQVLSDPVLSTKFGAADKAAADTQRTSLLGALESNPSAKAEYSKLIADPKNFMQADGTVMGDADKRAMERMLLQDVLNPGAQKYADYSGGEALKLALGYNSPEEKEAAENSKQAILANAAAIDVQPTTNGQGSYSGGGTKVLIPGTKGTKGVAASDWINKHPDLIPTLFGTPGNTVNTPVGTKEREVYAQPNGIYENQYKPVFVAGTVPGGKTPQFLSNIGHNIKEFVSGPYSSAKQGAEDLVNAFTPTKIPAATVLANPREYTPEAIKSALLETPGMTTTKARPTSSVKDTVLNEKATAFLSKYAEPKQTVTGGSKGVTDRTTWGKLGQAEEGTRKELVSQAILKSGLPDKEKQALLQDFNKSTQGTPGTKAQYVTTSGQDYHVPKGVTVTADNTYKGKVVVSSNGKPMDLSGVPTERRGTIVDMQREYESSVENAMKYRDALAEGARKLVGETAAKHGVTIQSLNAESVLKQTGLDGQPTPAEARHLKMMDSRFNAAVEQYKSDKDQANADRTFKLAVQKMNMENDQFWASMNQRAKFHSDDMAQKGSDAKLLPGYTIYHNPKTGKDEMTLLSSAVLAEKIALEKLTPEGQAKARETENSEYEKYAERNKSLFGLLGPKYENPSAWVKAGRPY